MSVALLAAALLGAAPDTLLLDRGYEDPAFAPDGRVALALHGDLWILPAAGAAPWRAVRVTEGEAWDQHPAWTADGALVFASDRGGNPDLWRVELAPGNRAARPVRLTDSALPESEPAPLPDGSVVFVRGRDADADLWIRRPNGSERRLTEAPGAERSPAASPDGRRIAYVAEREGRRELRVRALDGAPDRALADDHRAEHPAWSRDGESIVFATRGGRPGVWLVADDGSWINQISATPAAAAWHPSGDHLLLATLPREDAGYNGDPERLGPRVGDRLFPRAGRLALLRPTAVPDADRTELPAVAPVQRERFAAAVFDRAWAWLAGQYAEAGADRERDRQLAALRSRHRAAALRAATVAELEAVLHQLLVERPPLRREMVGRAAVSSAHPLATAAGIEMLRRGGNVVDAAVAVSFALGVVEPDASGVGGYGSMLIHRRGMSRPVAIEFLTRVPQEATLENGALLRDGRLPPDGPVLANVPGTVAGMWKAWSEHGSGRLRWAELLEPAIRLAAEGFVLDRALPTTLAVERERFSRYPSSRALFFRDGAPLRPGDTLRNPDLAWTLREIARGGADAFYRGEIARRMVADLRGQGNAMQLHDLDRYFAAQRAPVTTTYRGHTVYSSPPATSGGALLAAKLNLLEHFPNPRPYRDHAPTLHAMVEAWKLMPSTRGRIADPGLWPVEVEPFQSKDTARARWRCFDPARSSRPDEKGDVSCETPGEQPAEWGAPGVLHCASPDHATRGAGCRMTGTTAFVVADADGNLVSVTQTLGTWGGNFYVAPGLGFLYNDKLRSYADDPESYNARIPFARNVTSISPTLVFRGTGADARPWAAVGAAGNAWINAAVYQVIAGLVDQGLGPQQALESPRFLVGSERRPGGEREVVVQMEDGFSPEALARLRELGHVVQLISRKGELRMGYGAAVTVEDDRVRAGADPRRSGAAAAVGEREEGRRDQ